MRKGSLILLFIIIAVCSVFAGCSTNTPPMDQLNAPQNLRKLFNFLVWDEVENATGYVVYIEGMEHETEECRYSLLSLTEPGDYVIEVLALGDWENFKDSGWSKFNYTVNEKAPLKPTANLAYRLLEDGNGYEVSSGKADLNGTIVIPDEYNGLPVKRIADFAFCFYGVGSELDVEKGIGCNTKTRAVILPDSLESIGKAAFFAWTAIREIIIPEGVIAIEDNAFQHCINLQKVVLPSTLKEIGGYAFYDCAFSEIELPEELNKIGYGAFQNCAELSKINIPKGVTRLATYLFSGCKSLAEINFAGKLDSVEDNVFDGTAWIANHPKGFVTVKTVNDEVLVAYNGELPNGGVIDNIPSGVTHIARGAFPETELVSITVPQGVTLSWYCFNGFTALKKVVLQEGFTDIPKGTFKGCTALTEITLPDSLQKIEAIAFRGCTALTEITLNEGLKEIGLYAFDECEALTEVVLPSSLEVMGKNVFDGCVNLIAYYKGTKSDWIKRKIDGQYLKATYMHFYAETEVDVPDDGGNYWRYVNGEPVVWTKE